MVGEILGNEPFEVRIGDTWRWMRRVPGFPTADSVLIYGFSKADHHFEIQAAETGEDYIVDVPSATITGLTAGEYTWDAYILKDNNRFTVDHGVIKVLPDLRIGGGASVDRRTHAKKVLEAIEAVIEGRASKDQESYTINGRSLSRTPLAELLGARNQYRAEVNAERRRERVRNGKAAGNKVLVRFTD